MNNLAEELCYHTSYKFQLLKHFSHGRETSLFLNNQHCVKCVQIRNFFWSVFSRIRTEYGEIRSISPYSVRMRENTDQKKLRIWTLFTQCKDTELNDTVSILTLKSTPERRILWTQNAKRERICLINWHNYNITTWSTNYLGGTTPSFWHCKKYRNFT